MSKSMKRNEEQGALSEQIVQRTVDFLWKAVGVATDNEELMRDVVHSINDASPSSDYSNTVCRKCGVLRLPSNSVHRIKPKAKSNKAIQHALKRQKQSNLKRSNKLAKRFVNSKSTLLIHCKICQHTDRIPSLSRADVFEIKAEAKQSRSVRQTPSSTVSSRSNTPTGKRGSIGNFINKTINKTPNTTPRGKKKKSHLSQLLADEAAVSPSSSLTDFLNNLPQ